MAHDGDLYDCHLSRSPHTEIKQEKSFSRLFVWRGTDTEQVNDSQTEKVTLTLAVIDSDTFRSEYGEECFSNITPAFKLFTAKQPKRHVK